LMSIILPCSKALMVGSTSVFLLKEISFFSTTMGSGLFIFSGVVIEVLFLTEDRYSLLGLLNNYILIKFFYTT